MRKLPTVFLLLAVVVVWPLHSASTQEASTLPAPYEGLSRLHDLSDYGFEADVCISDVNGNEVEDILIVHREGVGTLSMPSSDPELKKSIVRAGFALVTLNEVLEAKVSPRSGRLSWSAS
jgi:hypothetical protein